MSGEATPSQMGALLMALRVRGETVDEITGAVTAMRAKMLRVEAPPDAIDVVGTGGDASGSFNISTCAALIVAGAGVPVAKHGNRALSSRSGAADVLAALGVNIDLDAGSDRPLHPRGRHRLHVRAGASSGDEECRGRPASSSAPARSSICSARCPIRPACAGRWSACSPGNGPQPLAQVLKNLGAERVWVVHGSDGLDEITTSGPTSVAALEDGAIRSFEISPEEVGLPQGQAGGAARRRRRGQCRGRARTCSRASSPVSRRGAAQRRGRAGRRRQGEDLKDGARSSPPNRSIPARPKAGSIG